MFEVDANLHKLSIEDRQFVELIVYNGLSAEDAYYSVFNVGDSELKDIKKKASNYLKRKGVRAYYESLLSDYREKNSDKAAWTLDKASATLSMLINKAEQELYTEGKPVTMARLSAIVQPVKELNTMYGLNNTQNINMEGGGAVVFVGESDIEK